MGRGTQSYDRALDDMLNLQADIARSVASNIVGLLSPESEAQIAVRPTGNIEAFSFYLRGRDYLRRPPDDVTLEIAVQFFNDATRLDPRFAKAHAGLCEAYLAMYFDTRDDDFFAKAEPACHRALTLNEERWETHGALGKLLAELGYTPD